MLLQILLDGVVDILRIFGTQMADGAIHQLQPGLDGPEADLLHSLGVADPLHMGIGAEFQIDAIGIIDGLLRQIFPDEIGQISTHIGA